LRLGGPRIEAIDISKP